MRGRTTHEGCAVKDISHNRYSLGLAARTTCAPLNIADIRLVLTPGHRSSIVAGSGVPDFVEVAEAKAGTHVRRCDGSIDEAHGHKRSKYATCQIRNLVWSGSQVPVTTRKD